MFLIMGINEGQKKLNYSQYMTCPCCGRSANIEIFMTYTYFMFFFIPLFKWNRRYFAVARCCGASAELDPEAGRAIERGEKDRLDPSEVNFIRGGAFSAGGYSSGGYSNPGSYSNGGYNEDIYADPYTGGYYEEGGIRERAAMNGAVDPKAKSQAAKSSDENGYIDEDGLYRVRIRTCKSCGYETGEDFQFCPKCGNPMKSRN